MRALELTPEMVTCDPDQAEVEVHSVAALMLKDSQKTLQKAWRFNQFSWLTEHQDTVRKRQLYRISPKQNAQVWMISWPLSLQTNHSSSSQDLTWITGLIHDLENLARQGFQSRSWQELVRQQLVTVTPQHTLSEHLVIPVPSHKAP